MMTPFRLLAVGLLLSAIAGAQAGKCGCDGSDPARMAARECSLCREAEKLPADSGVFFLKDVNPRKPNRWLALIRQHVDGDNPLTAMTAAQRTALWTAAIAKGKELWGDGWGVAFNGDAMRTQCHAHVHIGRLIDGVEMDNFVVVNGPAGIPVPRDGSGLWVHPVPGGKLHVHQGEQITETVLLR